MSTLVTALGVHGGKMFGPLRVTGGLTTTGVVHAGFYSSLNTNSYLDASIKLVGRTVRFGGHPVKGVGSPTSAGDLATNSYLTTRSVAELDRYVLPMYLHWADSADEDYDALTAHRSGDGLITVQGVIVLNIPTESRAAVTLISALPEDMRPSVVKLFPVFGNGTMYRCEIGPDGDIRLIHGPTGVPAGSRIVISGVCFYTS
jgi:hypothetical protein